MNVKKQRATGLRRYTSIPGLLHLLQNKKITLLSPSSWDDKNDAFFMSQYKKRRGLQSVLALCFTSATETYHHWRVFTHGSDGVCITFRQAALISSLSGIGNIRAGRVRYKRISELGTFRPEIDELPFLKRWPYKDEREFRIVYIDDREDVDVKSFDIDLTCIESITLSPWMTNSLAEAVKSTIRCIPGCTILRVRRTGLLENEKWKRSAVRSKTSRSK